MIGSPVQHHFSRSVQVTPLSRPGGHRIGIGAHTTVCFRRTKPAATVADESKQRVNGRRATRVPRRLFHRGPCAMEVAPLIATSASNSQQRRLSPPSSLPRSDHLSDSANSASRTNLKSSPG
jgi:hypothetical protein